MLTKVTFVKKSVMVHQCMIKSVVMWLRMLVVFLLCVYVTLFRGRASTLSLRYMGEWKCVCTLFILAVIGGECSASHSSRFASREVDL